jgi:sulfur carrier protein
MSGMMLTINGQSRELPEDVSLNGAVVKFCKAPEHVIAELNGKIIERAQWTSTRLNANDRLELVMFVGGG